MSDDADIEEPGEEIARLEATIEALAENLERSRKIDFVSKALMSGGALWFVAGSVGIVTPGAMTLIGSIAATIGGIVLLGSNRGSIREITAAIDSSEDRRRRLIGAMDLTVVHGGAETRSRAPLQRLH